MADMEEKVALCDEYGRLLDKHETEIAAEMTHDELAATVVSLLRTVAAIPAWVRDVERRLKALETRGSGR